MDETIDDGRAETPSDQLGYPDQVVDADGRVRDGRRFEGLLPVGVVVDEVTLHEADGAAVSQYDEELGRVLAVDGRPVGRLDRGWIVRLSPPRLDVRCGQPLTDEMEVRAAERAELDGRLLHLVDGTGCPVGLRRPPNGSPRR